jgi:hypothetical protein
LLEHTILFVKDCFFEAQCNSDEYAYGASHFFCHFLHWRWCYLTLREHKIISWIHTWGRTLMTYNIQWFFYGSDVGKMERILCS